MLFTKNIAAGIAIAATSFIQSTEALSVGADVDLTLDLGLPDLGSCSKDDDFLKIGVDVDINLGLDLNVDDILSDITSLLSKRDEHDQYLPAVSKRDVNATVGVVADLGILDVTCSDDDLFKVTLNFTTGAASQLLSLFADLDIAVSIGGLGDDGNGVSLIAGAGADVNVSNIFDFTAAVGIRASIGSGGDKCLPKGLYIRFDLNTDVDTDLRRLWDQIFSDSFVYNVAQDLANTKRELTTSRAPAGFSKRIDINAQLDALLQLATPDLTLPNFCWNSCCDQSSSSSASSSTPASSSSSSSSASSSSASSSESSSVPSTSSASSSSAVSSPVSSTPASSGNSSITSTTTVTGPTAGTTTGSGVVIVTVEPSTSGSASTSTVTGPTAGTTTGSGGVIVTVVPSSSGSASTSTVTGPKAGTSSGPSGVIVTVPAGKSSTNGGEKGTKTVSDTVGTTVVTITSCSDDKCTGSPVTTGVKVITKENTLYTTYCPLSTEGEASKPAESGAPASSAPATKAPAPVSTSVVTTTSGDVTSTYTTLLTEVLPSSGSAAPTGVAPASGAPASGAPASGAPASGAPASGAPASGAPAPSSAAAAVSSGPAVVPTQSGSIVPVVTTNAEGAANKIGSSVSVLLAGAFFLFNL